MRREIVVQRRDVRMYCAVSCVDCLAVKFRGRDWRIGSLSDAVRCHYPASPFLMDSSRYGIRDSIAV